MKVHTLLRVLEAPRYTFCAEHSILSESLKATDKFGRFQKYFDKTVVNVDVRIGEVLITFK